MDHRKNGCDRCKLANGCLDNLSESVYKNLPEEKKKLINLELSVRRKSVEDPNFPCEDTIREFMHTAQTLGYFDPSWKRPNITQSVKFCQKMLEWEIEYTFQKIVPIFTRWSLLFSENLFNQDLIPHEILKKRVNHGVPSFQIAWNVNNDDVSAILSLVPEESELVKDGRCITVEPQVLISEKLPTLYTEFIEKNTKTKGTRAKKTKSSDASDELDTVPEKPKRKYTKKSKENVVEDQLTCELLRSQSDTCLTSRENHSQDDEDDADTICTSFGSLCVGKSDDGNDTILLSDDSASDGTMDYDVSDIIDGIVSRNCFY